MRDLLAPANAPLLRSLARAGTLVVLDFDGTLAPIVGDRRAARLPRRSRAALETLARLYPVAILSGRGARDVRSRLDDVEVRWVVGSHGAEWPGEAGRHRRWHDLVGTWYASLAGRLRGLAGVDLEVKPLSLAVHYRRSHAPQRARSRIVAACRELPGAELVLGKMVVNLVPRGAGDKGTALARLAKVAGARRVLFVGDDVTDEAAFGARLGVPAITVRVGRASATRARYWLARRADVDVLLDRLGQLRGAAAAGRGAIAPDDGPVEADLERLGPGLAFMKDLWALEQGLNRSSKAMLRRHGVTGPQRLVVRVVSRLGAISPARLARVLHLHPSSVTRLVRRLEARHHVRRRPDPAHRGRFLLELGPRAGHVERLGAGTAEGAVQAALASASRRDVEATRRVIGEVTRRLLGGP